MPALSQACDDYRKLPVHTGDAKQFRLSVELNLAEIFPAELLQLSPSALPLCFWSNQPVIHRPQGQGSDLAHVRWSTRRKNNYCCRCCYYYGEIKSGNNMWTLHQLWKIREEVRVDITKRYAVSDRLRCRQTALSYFSNLLDLGACSSTGNVYVCLPDNKCNKQALSGLPHGRTDSRSAVHASFASFWQHRTFCVLTDPNKITLLKATFMYNIKQHSDRAIPTVHTSVEVTDPTLVFWRFV
jgi:hypothetical protein